MPAALPDGSGSRRGTVYPAPPFKLPRNGMKYVVMKSSRGLNSTPNYPDPNLIEHARASRIHRGFHLETHQTLKIYHQHARNYSHNPQSVPTGNSQVTLHGCLIKFGSGDFKPGQHFKVFCHSPWVLPELRGPMPSSRAGAMGGCVWSIRVILVHVFLKGGA